MARRFTADAKHVAFSIDCYLELEPTGDDSQYRLQAVPVRVLITGDYLLSIHQERVSLPARLAPYMPEGRSEQYAVYAVLDAMIASAFDALNEVEDALDDLSLTSTDLRGGRLRMATLRETSSRLSLLRRQAAPKRSLRAHRPRDNANRGSRGGRGALLRAHRRAAQSSGRRD